MLAEASVADSAAYLWFLVGPAAAFDAIWAAAAQKWSHRVSEAAARPQAPRKAAVEARIRAATVLQYIGQLVPPPRAVTSREGWALAKLLRAPGNTFSREGARPTAWTPAAAGPGTH